MVCIGCHIEYLTNFCPGCRHSAPGALRGVKLVGFTGRASLSPSVEKFWATGDPSAVDEKL